MNFINNQKCSDLKSQVKLLNMISELYKEDIKNNNITDIHFNFNDDYKEQILSNIKKATDNKILVKILFSIFIHEIEINESASEFNEVKNNIWKLLKKDNTLDTFNVIIEHIDFMHKTYNCVYDIINFSEYLNSFNNLSSVEDKILTVLPFNTYTESFYIHLGDLCSTQYQIDQFYSLFLKLDFENDELESISNKKNPLNANFPYSLFLLKELSISYCLEKDNLHIKNIKFSNNYLTYLLKYYINCDGYYDGCFFDDDLEYLHYFHNFSLSSFLQQEITSIYEDFNIKILLHSDYAGGNIRESFFNKVNKIKNIIKTKSSVSRDFNKEILNFLTSNFSINYWINFINIDMYDLISCNLLEEIRSSEHNISDFKSTYNLSDTLVIKNQSQKTFDFLLNKGTFDETFDFSHNGNIHKKIKQYLMYQEYPFNYFIFISEFINIYEKQSDYMYVDLTINKENITLKEQHSNNKIVKDSSCLNEKINLFIKDVYISTHIQSERNKKLGSFASKLNIKQFEIFIKILVSYHKKHNISLNIDDKKSITLDILQILNKCNIENYEEYRTTLINSISGYSKFDLDIKSSSTLITYPELNNEHIDKLDGNIFIDSYDEDEEEYEKEKEKENSIDSYVDEETDISIKLAKNEKENINKYIVDIYENNNLNKEDKSIFFSKAIKYYDIDLFEYSIIALREYHTKNNIPFFTEDKKEISFIILEELSSTILFDEEYNEYRKVLIEAITGFEEHIQAKHKENQEENSSIVFSENNNEDSDLDDTMMNIISLLEEEMRSSKTNETDYVKTENTSIEGPTYEIFTSDDEIEIQNYADDLGDEGKGIKNQLRKIRKTSNKRKLRSSSKFFENIDSLRNNFPNFDEFITAIEDYSLLNQLGDNHFYIPPSLLVGDPGIGKTFFLSELSDTIGIENKMIHMETISASWLLVGSSSQWKDAKPGIIYDNIINSKYANNIFILDELDKMMSSNYPVDNCLLQLFEKHTSKEFKDEYIPLKIDISKTIWLATANSLSTISAPILSRLQTYKISNPNFNERKKLAQNIYKHMLSENTWGSHFNSIIPDATLDKLCEPADSIREMKKVLLKAITHSARRKDNVITIEDVISVHTTSKNKVGFA